MNFTPEQIAQFFEYRIYTLSRKEDILDEVELLIRRHGGSALNPVRERISTSLGERLFDLIRGSVED